MSKYSNDDLAAITQTAIRLFEGQSDDDAKQFAVEFLRNLDVGADLEDIRGRFHRFLIDENLPILKENLERVSAMDIPSDLKSAARAAIEGVIALHEKSDHMEESELELACKTAEDTAHMIRSAGTPCRAAEDAVISALWYCRSIVSSTSPAVWYTADATWSAALSAKYSARSAGLSGRPAMLAAYKRYANELIQLLKYTL